MKFGLIISGQKKTLREEHDLLLTTLLGSTSQERIVIL